MISVRVDFNSRGRGGLVRASMRRADAPIQEGEKVCAVDYDEHMAYVAVVAQIEPSGRVWLDVDWHASSPSWMAITQTSGLVINDYPSEAPGLVRVTGESGSISAAPQPVAAGSSS